VRFSEFNWIMNYFKRETRCTRSIGPWAGQTMPVHWSTMVQAVAEAAQLAGDKHAVAPGRRSSP
jgi:hypothetical protein